MSTPTSKGFNICVWKSSLGWRYQLVVAGHVIREDGNYAEPADAVWAAETFLDTADSRTEMEGAA